jgi:hypothetical protein
MLENSKAKPGVDGMQPPRYANVNNLSVAITQPERNRRRFASDPLPNNFCKNSAGVQRS